MSQRPSPISANATSTGVPTSLPSEPISPAPFSPIPNGNLTAKGIDTTNTPYPMSYVRTPVTRLPFPHPKFHIRPSTGEIYEVTSPIHEEYDPVTGYVDDVRGSRSSNHDGRRGNEGDTLGKPWTGRVEWPESKERTSIAREAKRDREDSKGRFGGGADEIGVRRSKRVRDKK